jgi:hypothetical protein
METISVGTVITYNNKFYGEDDNGNRAWVDDVSKAFIWNKDLPSAKTILDNHPYIVGEDEATLLPVKKITSYQLGEF